MTRKTLKDKRSTLNSQLSENEAAFQLTVAREEIIELQGQINDIWNRFKAYQCAEKQIPFNVEFLYYQLQFMMGHDERYGRIITKNGKIVRLEAAYQ